MAVTVFVVTVLLFYFIIWFFDSFFKSCMHYPYYAFLEGTGLRVGLLNFSWKTTAFNRLIFRWGKKGSRFLKELYTVGYIFTVVIFLPFSIWVLASTLISNLSSEHVEAATEIETIIPGVNVPNSDLLAYFISLALCSIFHELGHAIAAIQEDIPILNVGFYMFFIIPIAFVELNSDQLNAISVKRKLRIYCAGVWHNVILGLLAFCLFFSVSPLFRLGYAIGDGVLVKGITPLSPLLGDRGLSNGDQIISINDCKVRDSKDWNYCIYTMSKEKFGLCVSSEFVSKNDEIAVVTYKDNDLIDCCRPEDIHNLCFEYIEPAFGEVSLAPQYSCLKPRDVIREQFIKCSKDKMCLNNDHCLKPLLGNSTSLFIIERSNYEPVLYIGSPYDLSSTVMIDNYVPKYDILSIFSPQAIEKILQYIFMFSLGIAIVNTIPCFGADGHHIARNIIQFVALRLNKNKEFVNVTTFCVVLLGTLAMIPCLCYLFVKAVMSSH